MLLVLNAMSQGTLIISFMVIVVIREILEAPDFSSALKITFLGLLVVIGYRYCYLLEDLSPKLLAEKHSTLESLGDYLHFQGQEALLTEKAQTCAGKSWQQSLVMELQHRMWMIQQTNFWAGVAKIIFNQMASMLDHPHAMLELHY
ncbi:hypothetical protein BDL97_02G041000 [Sphagnum fallax]|nr:hypothetical protein BDL97_02G041000 [Sphagnum fallax]